MFEVGFRFNSSELNGVIRDLVTNSEKILDPIIERNTENAAKFLRDRIKGAYADNSGKKAISPLTKQWRKSGGSIPLNDTAELLNAVIAKQDKRSKNSSTWVVRLEPSRHHKSGRWGNRSDIAIATLAAMHESGFTATMPRTGARVKVPARPIWDKTFNKWSQQILEKLTQI